MLIKKNSCNEILHGQCNSVFEAPRAPTSFCSPKRYLIKVELLSYSELQFLTLKNGRHGYDSNFEIYK